MARSLSRSSDVPSDASPTKSVHWEESDGKEIDKPAEQSLCVHAHACLRFHHTTWLDWDRDLMLMEEKAYVSVPTANVRTRSRINLNCVNAFFYLQVPETSTTVAGGNRHPFHSHLVNSDWMVNMWQHEHHDE